MEVYLCIIIEKHVKNLVCDIMDIGNNNLIFGMNWLCMHNLIIDWSYSMVKFNSCQCTKQCLPAVAP